MKITVVSVSTITCFIFSCPFSMAQIPNLKGRSLKTIHASQKETEVNKLRIKILKQKGRL